jgi:hypothetical protein
MLKPSEREKLQDCQMLVESARNILLGIAVGVVPEANDIEKCFREADRALTRLLRA